MSRNALYTAGQSKNIDQIIIDQMKINGVDLMAKAAFACFTEIQKAPCSKVTVICGAGNNAGDGLMVAALCHMSGMSVTVYLCCPSVKLAQDSQYMLNHAKLLGVKIKRLEVVDTSCIEDLSSSDTVVDGIFGTGVNKEVEGVFKAIINAVNQYAHYALSIDVPSGVCASTGKVFNVAIIANKTVSFICRKVGLYTGVAPDYVGKRVFVPLVNDVVEIDEIPVAELLDKSSIAGYLKLLPDKRVINKGDRGHLALIAGDKGMFGAAVLAAVAALKSGAGRVSIFTRPDNNCSSVNAVYPEIMCHKLYSAEAFLDQKDKFDVIALGCGLSVGLEWSRKIIPELLNIDKTMVIDAGALDFLSKKHLCFSSPRIITPHEGEAARMLNMDAQSVKNDRISAVKDLARWFDVSVLLKKGCGSLLHVDNKLYLSPYGHSILATAGSGDLLTGFIGGLAAQTGALESASLLALLLQGVGAENYANRHGCYGFTAFKLLDEMVSVMNLSVSPSRF